MSHEIVSGTVVLGTPAPTLTEMKSRLCTQEELQAGLVQLIEIFNRSQEEFARLGKSVAGKQNKEWRATL